jgi:hypothetical protein
MRIFALALLVALALAACSSSEDITSADVVVEIPWRGPEVAQYRVLDHDDNPVGTLELSIGEEAAGAWRLRQYFDFPDKGFTNEAVVIVDGSTLQPESATFKIVGPDGNLDCDATYTTGQVKSHRIGADGEREDVVDIPHIAYDSWGDLFVWRTIDFSEGYEKDYADTLSCTLARPDKIAVSLKIEEKQSITVPAGTFDTWHLQIHSGGADQDAWYTTDDAHRLIKYDNGESTFELTSAPGG